MFLSSFAYLISILEKLYNTQKKLQTTTKQHTFILDSFQSCNLFNSSQESQEQLICKTPDLSKKIKLNETKMEMVVLFEDDDHHWNQWRPKSEPSYMLVYPNPVFQSFNTTDKTEVFANQKLLSIYVRCRTFYIKALVMMFNLQKALNQFRF